MLKITSAFFLALFALPAQAAPPKLLVSLVIDQFRADNISRYQSRYLPVKTKEGVGGFRYLMSRAAYYPFASYDIMQPMTGPGHATVLTGTYPYVGGIPLNEWYDFAKNDFVYCVEDQSFLTVGQGGKSKHLGTSPRNFLGSTLGDEMKNSGRLSKVVSIALKDRAAILMGGHRADLALWMDSDTFLWVSSGFYFPDNKLPSWIESLNGKLAKRAGETFTWAPAVQPALPALVTKQSGKYAQSIGSKFPHAITRGTLSELASPAGLELTAEAAEEAIMQMKLGAGPATDLLAVSLSSHDYVGHGFGPNSRENEEMVVAEDRVLSRLFNFLDKKVGLKNVVITLTADHGVAPTAEWLQANRMNAGVIDDDALTAEMEKKLAQKFGKPEGGKWIAHQAELNFWLTRAAVKKPGLEAVANELKRLLLLENPFAYAITGGDVANRKLPPGMHERRILKTYVPERSGDVVGLVKPFFYPKGNTANHLADYSYDETVPLFIAGDGIKPGRYGQKAEVVDLAPTLAFLLDIIPPALSEGRVLHEAIEQKKP